MLKIKVENKISVERLANKTDHVENRGGARNKGEKLDHSVKVSEKCKTQFEKLRRDHGKALG